MTIQIAIRLPDDLVEYIDSHVSAGDAASRADMVKRALERERRHEADLRDAAIYAEHGDSDPELDAWVMWTAAHPTNVDEA
jgi:Arc/MetJ-type ribon-helix-helix transcriptional regulator